MCEDNRDTSYVLKDKKQCLLLKLQLVFSPLALSAKVVTVDMRAKGK